MFVKFKKLWLWFYRHCLLNLVNMIAYLVGHLLSKMGYAVATDP